LVLLDLVSRFSCVRISLKPDFAEF